MRSSIAFSVVLAVLFVFAAKPGFPAPVYFSTSTGQDTWINENNPGTSYNDDSSFYLSVEWDGYDGSAGGGKTQGLIKFDIPHWALQDFKDLGDPEAKLTYTLVDDPDYHVGDPPGDDGELYRMTTDWDDSATWNSMVGGITDDQYDESSHIDVPGSGSAGTSHTIDVTDDVLEWAGGDQNYGWAILPTDGDGVQIYSLDSDYKPNLELNVPVPEPCTWVLFGLGALGLLGLRRKRK